MCKFNEYPSKATPEDADTLMLYDAASKSNKLSPFSGIWNWIVGKLTNAVISNLQTNDKTVLGAINELNSKKICTQQIYGGAIYKDCNDLPAGESATAFSSAKNKPSGDNTWYIFCMSADNIKTQIAISVNSPSVVLRRTYNGTWGDWE